MMLQRGKRQPGLRQPPLPKLQNGNDDANPLVRSRDEAGGVQELGASDGDPDREAGTSPTPKCRKEVVAKYWKRNGVSALEAKELERVTKGCFQMPAAYRRKMATITNHQSLHPHPQNACPFINWKAMCSLNSSD